MADYVTLMGAEQVQRAGSAMQSAAQDMIRAADRFQGALEQNQRFMDDWLLRLRDLLEVHANGQTKG